MSTCSLAAEGAILQSSPRIAVDTESKTTHAKTKEDSFALSLGKGAAIWAAEAGRLADAVLPAVPHYLAKVPVDFLTSILLPEALHRVTSGITDFLAKGTGTVLKAVLHGRTFGALPWADVLTRSMAVSDVNAAVGTARTAREALARCFACSTAPEEMRELLFEYAELREQLRTLREAGEKDPAAIKKCAQEIALRESALSKYARAAEFKAILDRGAGELSGGLHQAAAGEIADWMIKRVSEYPKGYFGPFGGEWVKLATKGSPEEARAALVQAIAERFSNAEKEALSGEETLGRVSDALSQAFGLAEAKRRAFLYSVLGVLYQTGALAAVARELGEAAGNAVGSAGNFIWNVTPEPVKWGLSTAWKVACWGISLFSSHAGGAGAEAAGGSPAWLKSALDIMLNPGGAASAGLEVGAKVAAGAVDAGSQGMAAMGGHLAGEMLNQGASFAVTPSVVVGTAGAGVQAAAGATAEKVVGGLVEHAVAGSAPEAASMAGSMAGVAAHMATENAVSGAVGVVETGVKAVEQGLESAWQFLTGPGTLSPAGSAGAAAAKGWFGW